MGARTQGRPAKKASAIAFAEIRAREQCEPATGAAIEIEIEIRGHLIRVRDSADLRLLEAVLAMVSRC